MNDDTLVVAQIYMSDAEANIALGMLRANGIPCTLDHEIISNVLAIPSTVSIRLMVRSEDLAEALTLLNN